MRLRVQFDETDAHIRIFNTDRRDKICYARGSVSLASLKDDKTHVTAIITGLQLAARTKLGRAMGVPSVPHHVKGGKDAK